MVSRSKPQSKSASVLPKVPVNAPDDVWNEAARHYSEQGLATLIVAITTINAWNRLNVSTKQVAFGRLPDHVHA